MPAPVADEARLAVRLVEFNLHVARFAHLSWFGDAVEARLCRRAEPVLSQWLLGELGLDNEVDWQMSEPQKRVWLLDASSVRRLAQELALAMHRNWLWRTIDARRLRALKASLSEGAVEFALAELPAGQCHYPTPSVDFEKDSGAELSRKLTLAGARSLIELLSPTWRAVRGRAQLFFERAQNLGEVGPCEATQRDQILALLGEWLIPRRFPAWDWCF